MQRRNNLALHWLVLIVGVIACGVISVAIGKDLNWDLASYHFYNPYAFLNHRSGQDVWPLEFIHIHLTPTADFITYYFITVLSPKLAVFTLGALHGINVWLLYAIARELFSSYSRALAIVLAVLGIYGPTVLPGIGSFQHDALISLFVLGFILLFLKAMTQGFSRKLMVSAGFCLGVGAGLKLTAGIFILGAILSTFFVAENYKKKISIVCWLSFGLIIGLLLTSGYWMLMQWQQFHSPVFPFMNGVFHSPDFPAYSWKDARFMPKNIWQAVFYPFYFSLDGRTNDMPFRDFRFALVYLLVAWCAVKRFPLQGQSRWLVAFFVTSYLIWQLGFSIMRYAMPLEMLAPIMIFLLLKALVKDTMVRMGLALVMLVIIVLGMHPAEPIRAPWYGTSYFNVVLPLTAQHASHAMVLMPVSAYSLQLMPRPQTYLIPLLPKKWRYLGIPFQGESYRLNAQMSASIDGFNGRLFVLASSDYLPAMTLIAKQLGLIRDGVCADITSDRQKVSYENVKLCPFKKLSSAIHPSENAGQG